MKDAYSCDLDEAGLDASYQREYEAYARTFERLGLEAIAVASDVGMMGGTAAHEFMVLNPAGEDLLVLCEQCGYSANRQVAYGSPPGRRRRPPRCRWRRSRPPGRPRSRAGRVPRIDPAGTAKAAFFVTADGRLMTAIVRGDREVNETKLVNAVKATGIRPATVEEIRAAGMEPGYGSPIGAHGTTIVVDDLAARSPNLVAGANRRLAHPQRERRARLHARRGHRHHNAQRGRRLPELRKPVVLRQGIEVGNIFKLGTEFTEESARPISPRTAAAADRDGQVRDRAGTGVACIVEAHHDDKGIVWPAAVAPYPAHLVAIGANKEPRSARSRSGSTSREPPRAASCSTTTATSRPG